MKKAIEFENIFLVALGSKERLKYYLENNTNVFQYLQQTNPGLIAVLNIAFAFISKSKKQEIMDNFNLKRVLYLLEKNRPDIYSTLISCSWGNRWLEYQIEDFKRRFL